MALHLRLLGRPGLEVDGEPLEPPATKVSALLYHLGFRGGWVARDELAGLLWPEIAEENARANLRKVIARTRALPYARELESERTRLRWCVSTDVRALQEALTDDDPTRIVAHYRGPLLEGFRLDDAPGFDDWLETEREELHGAWRAALSRCVATLEPSEPERALPLLRTLWDDDPLDEEVLQRYLRCARGRADRGQALRAYDRFCSLLEDEMGLEPLGATTALAERAREEPGPADATPPAASPPPVPERGDARTQRPAVALGERPPAVPELPREITPFVDRPDDLRRIAARLDEPGCRLLTLVGPGGVGKTRLALRTVMHRESRYHDGVRAVALAQVETHAELVNAVAVAVGLEQGNDSEAHLFEHLRDVEMLLMLDNFEQLVPEATWLPELLRAAPGLQLLVTSRASLDLVGEWIFPVAGLAFPEAGTADDAEAWPAVALFRQSALRHGLTALEGDAAAIARICRSVEGMPLALELAASWVRVLGIDEIATELEADAGLLTSSERDLPERHRSMDAVFDYSWSLLTPVQQRTLARLAIFRGGFDRQAAAEVAGAAPRDLLELVGRSLLRRRDSGRFDLHPLIRQCAYRRLAERPDEEEALRERHGAHFLSVLHRCDDLRRSGQPREALDRFDLEYANLRAMWQWAVASRRVDELEQCAAAVEQYYIQRNRYREGIDLLGDAAANLDATEPAHHAAIGRLLVSRGWIHARMGDYDAGRRCTERARTLLEPLEPRIALCECINLQGTIAGLTGSYGEAKSAFERALAMAEQLGEERHAAFYLNNLAITERNLGNPLQAERLYRRALSLGRRLGELVTVVRNLNNLGLLLHARGDLDGAEACLHEGLELAREMGFEQPLSHLNASLGETAFERGCLDEAEERFREALRRVRASGSRGLEAELLGNLGMVAVARGDPAAVELFRRGLELARELGSAREGLGIVGEVAWLWAGTRGPAAATELLERVLRHPATDNGARIRAARLAQEIGVDPPVATTETAAGSPDADDAEPLEALIERLLRQL